MDEIDAHEIVKPLLYEVIEDKFDNGILCQGPHLLSNGNHLINISKTKEGRMVGTVQETGEEIYLDSLSGKELLLIGTWNLKQQ